MKGLKTLSLTQSHGTNALNFTANATIENTIHFRKYYMHENDHLIPRYWVAFIKTKQTRSSYKGDFIGNKLE